MTTDLERLQKVRSGQLTGRGVGKTYASCYSACEYLRDNPDGVVFWLVPKMSWVNHIQSIFDKLFEEFEFKDVKKYRYGYKHPIIFFKLVRTDTPWHTDEDIRWNTKGYRNYHTIYDSIYSYQGDY